MGVFVERSGHFAGFCKVRGRIYALAASLAVAQKNTPDCEQPEGHDWQQLLLGLLGCRACLVLHRHGIFSPVSHWMKLQVMLASASSGTDLTHHAGTRDAFVASWFCFNGVMDQSDPMKLMHGPLGAALHLVTVPMGTSFRLPLLWLCMAYRLLGLMAKHRDLKLRWLWRWSWRSSLPASGLLQILAVGLIWEAAPPAWPFGALLQQLAGMQWCGSWTRTGNLGAYRRSDACMEPGLHCLHKNRLQAKCIKQV